ncbi:NPCBM/NEW2 domain-containing protein [Luteolibacter yonseiensis]|uniref:NPCBM/NEW2 domain-containing protein n=1 Tax=Luteolibacter yonseiensis TaxID=1144680 RepID=A0A934R393_9BACT|nr:NPCBM/NEW2 domain-containing protein [Luteolibacter yonseiensis]MBK1816236.1 NPCBM/NEW2 domain-containing protein [Luteolibacter yonseiensis]
MIRAKSIWAAWMCWVGLLSAAIGASQGDDVAGSAMLRDAMKHISAYHVGQPKSDKVLRVVYFTPGDRDPLADHAGRLDRILDDVAGFYREGFKRFGQDTGGLPLERKDGKLVIHQVKGKLPASSYTYESGSITKAEVRAALKGIVDMDREHVLILYALCHQESDGRYVFNSPYYGDGASSNSSGLCHAADCELLDPRLLGETEKQMVYTEHYYPRVEQTIGKFNGWYIGGIAHELGHGLGLPHDNGSKEERGFGSSLMGGGNLHYRGELWGDRAPAFLSRATALQLASHPLMTRSDKGRDTEAHGYFEKLEFSGNAGELHIKGKTAGAVPAYGAIAYIWPMSAKTDHRAVTCPVVLEEGGFEMDIAGLRPDSYWLKLNSLHVNGAVSNEYFVLKVDKSNQINLAEMNGEWLVDRADLAIHRQDPRAREFVSDEVISAAPTAESAGKLRVLRGLLDPAVPADLSSAKEDHAWLSDAAWTKAEVGWGMPTRNAFWSDGRFRMGTFLTLKQKPYEKGLYAHAPSHYGFAVDQKWKTFTATVGLRDGAQAVGSAVFVVRGDGKELYRSELLRAGENADVSVDVSGVKNLELLTEGGNGNTSNAWSIWVDPKVTR